MISKILFAVLTKLGSLLITELFKYRAKKETEAAAETAIDDRLAKVKAITTEVLDGKPMTKEQREKFNSAISDFLRGGSNGGV